MRTIWIVGLGLFFGVAGCSKEKEGGAGAAASATGATGASPSAPTTSLTQAQIDEAYKLTDPDNVEKSLKDVTGKLGAPQKTEGDTSIWYGAGKDGATCYQLKISKGKGIESGTTDKASCGLK